MNRCPFCFHDLSGEEAAFVCTDPTGECADVADERWRAFHGDGATTRRPVTRVAPGPEDKRWKRPHTAACSTCGAATATEACPRCHHLLPPGWRDVQTTCLAMAGARTSGKSVYLAVAVKQAAQLAQALGGALGYGDTETETVYVERYEAPLFRSRGLLQPTATHSATDTTTRIPLVFTLGVLNGARHVLVVRDVAGEDLENAQVERGPFRFLRDADGIVFLVDPLKRDAVRLMLAGIIDDRAAVGGEPLTVLDNITRLMREPGSSERIDVPLAVVLSKFDALRELRQVKGSRWDAVMANAGAALNRDPSDSTSFQTDEADLLQAEVESMLARLGETGVLNRLRSDFSTTRLFTVSALGAPPKGPSVNAHGIAPFRCLDPLKWLLSRTGAVRAA